MKCVTTVYSRITGFYQPTTTWNPGKLAEFKDRKHYELKGDNMKYNDIPIVELTGVPEDMMVMVNTKGRTETLLTGVK